MEYSQVIETISRVWCGARIIARMKHVLGERTIEPHPSIFLTTEGCGAIRSLRVHDHLLAIGGSRHANIEYFG